MYVKQRRGKCALRRRPTQLVESRVRHTLLRHAADLRGESGAKRDGTLVYATPVHVHDVARQVPAKQP